MSSSLSRLHDIIDSLGSALVGFSGGVDSALLSVLARKRLGRQRTLAVLGVSASLAERQRRQAQELAEKFDLRLLELETAELGDENYRANTPERCYFCKHELWSNLVEVARREGLETVLDGANADDLGEHRPGLRAGRELAVRAPLAEAGFSKKMVRDAARSMGLPVWNAPAAPCLASRIRYGVAVTEERLRQVERGEELLRDAGVSGDLRVRHRGDEARIEVGSEQFDLIRAARTRIARGFHGLGFRRVTLDLKGYRRGSFLSAEEPVLEAILDAD